MFAGIQLIGLDGTMYDQVLDWVHTMGIIPSRFQVCGMVSTGPALDKLAVAWHDFAEPILSSKPFVFHSGRAIAMLASCSWTLQCSLPGAA